MAFTSLTIIFVETAFERDAESLTDRELNFLRMRQMRDCQDLCDAVGNRQAYEEYKHNHPSFLLEAPAQ